MFFDERLIGLLRKQKGKRVLGRSSEKEDGQKQIKRVRVGQGEVHLARWENV